MLRVVIVGCGKIADQHVHAIRRIKDCQIVGLCDQEELMARQLGERFGIQAVFADATEMLLHARPDIVHITTPPQTHFPLAAQCLKAGVHVYVEKPFTVTMNEALSLVTLADEVGLKITAGHNLQFTLEMLDLRRLVQTGFLGGKPVHLESHFSYNLGDNSYVGPLLGNRSHWVRRLPGQLFHNVISHGIAKLVEFLDDDLVEVQASAFQSGLLKSLGGREVLDELRVMMRDVAGTTAFFCFSTQARPGLNQLRIYGRANSLVVDHASGTLLRQEARSSKSYLTYFAPPLRMARLHLQNAQRNVVRFLRRELYQDYGLKELIERFYASVRTQGPPPIPYRQIVLTARIMDDIFSQIYPPKAEAHCAREGIQARLAALAN